MCPFAARPSWLANPGFSCCLSRSPLESHFNTKFVSAETIIDLSCLPVLHRCAKSTVAVQPQCPSRPGGHWVQADWRPGNLSDASHKNPPSRPAPWIRAVLAMPVHRQRPKITLAFPAFLPHPIDMMMCKSAPKCIALVHMAIAGRDSGSRSGFGMQISKQLIFQDS